jgi:hypothetical protein
MSEQVAEQVRVCEARQYSDAMVCVRCAMSWDVNDPEPPECAVTGGRAMQMVVRLRPPRGR